MAASRDDVWKTILAVIDDLEKDGLDSRELDTSSRLAEDLGLSSVDSIHLAISLEDAFRQQLSIETLVIQNGAYVSGLTLGALHDHICERLRASA
jgi:acyl carrier protein